MFYIFFKIHFIIKLFLRKHLCSWLLKFSHLAEFFTCQRTQEKVNGKFHPQNM